MKILGQTKDQYSIVATSIGVVSRNPKVVSSIPACSPWRIYTKDLNTGNINAGQWFPNYMRSNIRIKRVNTPLPTVKSIPQSRKRVTREDPKIRPWRLLKHVISEQLPLLPDNKLRERHLTIEAIFYKINDIFTESERFTQQLPLAEENDINYLNFQTR
jgi:hypothetical protein